jgi:autotransporter family porin
MSIAPWDTADGDAVDHSAALRSVTLRTLRELTGAALMSGFVLACGMAEVAAATTGMLRAPGEVSAAPLTLALLPRIVAPSATAAATPEPFLLAQHRRKRPPAKSPPAGGSGSGGSAPPPADDRFVTLAPGSALPSGATCASRVRRSAWEPRPQNAIANGTVGVSGVSIDGANATFNRTYAPRIDGAFTGTTDEILQWGACKWGFNEDITRARAVQESWWRQSQLGDSTSSATACAIIGQTAPCWQSYGILQVKGTVHRGTYPLARNSTAYNVDYALAWLRACFEGAFGHWLSNGYRAGDEWGCVGAWYSGEWYDDGARGYIDSVRRHLANRVWEQRGF